MRGFLGGRLSSRLERMGVLDIDGQISVVCTQRLALALAYVTSVLCRDHLASKELKLSSIFGGVDKLKGIS